MISLILARGGSKGIPKKNIKQLMGKPLIEYVITSAKESKKITDIYVSSDDEEIIEISKNLGCKIIVRPHDLSTDTSLDIDSFRHFCKELNHAEPIIHLRATTPLVSSLVIDDAIEVFLKNKNKITSLRSAHETSESVYKFYKKNGEFWGPIVDNLDTNLPRQSYPKTYSPNGYVDIVKPEIFMNSDSFYGDKIYSFITDKTYEIDTIDDFNYIEYILSKKKCISFS
jgi:CMP-N,N'-diacetyllegionaminic acid synthase